MALAAIFPVFQWFDDHGDPLDSGFIFTYYAGTTTAADTYADAQYLALMTNPIELNAAGRATFYMLPIAYKLIIKDQNNVQVGDVIDNVRLNGAGDLKVTPIVTTYTATYDDDIIEITSGGPFTLTLPTAVSHTGKIFIIKNLTATAITVDAHLTETIDGVTTFVLNTLNESITIWSDGVNWKLASNFI